MSNLILRANLNNTNFIVKNSITPLPLEENTVELSIVAANGYSIDAKDFYNGLLPPEIKSIEYNNFKNKIIAQVHVNKLDQHIKNVNIALPINGVAKSLKHNFNIIEKNDISEHVESSTHSSLNKSIVDGQTTYHVLNNPGNKKLILDKKFFVTDNGYFSTGPLYKINGDKNRYTAVTSIQENGRGKIVSKVFKIYYTSPVDIKDNNNTDTITFTAKLSYPKEKLSEKVVNTEQSKKIYSFNPGYDYGAEGGTKRITVKGVAGTTFKLMISDQDGKTYNDKNGTFEEGGGLTEGIVPFPEEGKAFGEFSLLVEIPKRLTANVITTRLIEETTVAHENIISPETAEAAMHPSSKKVKEIIVAPNSKLTMSFINAGGFDAVLTNDAATADLIIGPGAHGTSSKLVYFKVQVFATSKTIIIDRQPLHSPDIDGVSTYVNWDSGSDKAEALTSTGVSITNDWYLSDADQAKNALWKAGAKVEGVGNAVVTGKTGTGYNSVIVSGVIMVGKFGTGDINPQLDLLNFLTLSP